MADCCTKLLSEGLDLCVRARRLDAQQRSNDMAEFFPGFDLEKGAAGLTANRPDAPYLPKSATIPLWVQDQYETDLADWERRTRRHLTQGCDADGKGEG